MSLFVGGPIDGQERDVPRGTITWTAEGQRYLAIEFKDDANKMHTFFMAAGMKPSEALSQWHSLKKNTKP